MARIARVTKYLDNVVDQLLVVVGERVELVEGAGGVAMVSGLGHQQLAEAV